MADFQEIMSIFKRMCDSCVDSSCGMNQIPGLGCRTYIYKHPKEAEELLLKWAEEHPAKTNADKFEEVFGVKPVLKGCQGLCQCIADCSDCEYDGFWSKEYKER